LKSKQFLLSQIVEKMSITPEQVQQAYRVSKEVYEEKMTIGEAKTYLHSNYKLNAGSAQTFIYVFRDMLNGKGFTRGLAIMPTHYYLSQILAEYGKPTLKQALKAFMEHINYYENRRHTTMQGLRDVHKEFSALL
jgi:5-methylcytosine-specific restriction enzyme A